MSWNERFNKLYRHGINAAGFGFAGAIIFGLLAGPTKYPGTGNIFSIISGFLAMIFLIGLISIIIGFIGKSLFK